MIEMPTDDEPVKVIQGDCLDVLRQLPDGCVDAVVTDPPYLVGKSLKYKFDNVAACSVPTATVGDEWGYSLDWVAAVGRLQPAHWVVCCNYKMLGDVCHAIGEFAEVAGVFVWRKPNAPHPVRPVPRLDCEFIVWAKRNGASNGDMKQFRSQVIDIPMPQAGCMADERIVKPGTGQAAHPCQKPLKLMRMFVSRLPCETILDPFAGSGTTGAAAMREGRKCLLIEKEPTYCDIIRRRLSEAGTLFAGV